MSETLAIDDEPLPDLHDMLAMAWRGAARAIRAGRAGEALRWLSVHARLERMARAGAPPEPGPASSVTAEHEPSAPSTQRSAPARANAAPELHQLHQLHRAFAGAPVQSAGAGPDPP
ncbi:MAG: hypothetical protein ACK4FB_12520 [Brevundimonas sp.]|uniref:hypothetical protein n=1 Tax=Brevundimonas sp. TaxID=1871086 RepID=UPI0039193F0B